MRFARPSSGLALAAMIVMAAAPAGAGTVEISGTRSNISPGGTPGGRCAPALTITFGPGAFAAGGTSNLGDFTYVASHCIAAPPPGTYFDGVFEWTLPGGTLSGTHVGTLSATATPGVFGVFESLLFTGGTGLFSGATGSANATGTLRFGQYNGLPASFGDVSFAGQLSAPAVPEPATWALMAMGLGLVGVVRRRRDAAA